jgi:hypothetical protein
VNQHQRSLTCSSADIGGERKIAYIVQFTDRLALTICLQGRFRESLEILQSGSRYRPYREFLCGTCRVHACGSPITGLPKAPGRQYSNQFAHQASPRQTGHLCTLHRNCRLGAATFLSRSKLMIVADQRVGSLGSRSGRSRVGFATLLAAGRGIDQSSTCSAMLRASSTSMPR